MFIQKMEGSWFKHPFWKSRLRLDHPDSLSHFHQSDLPSVIIDTEKGKDVIAAPTVALAVAGATVRPNPVARRRASPVVAALKTRQSVDLSSTSRSTVELSRCYGQDEIAGAADLANLVLPEPNILRELSFLRGHNIRS